MTIKRVDRQNHTHTGVRYRDQELNSLENIITARGGVLLSNTTISRTKTSSRGWKSQSTERSPQHLSNDIISPYVVSSAVIVETIEMGKRSHHDRRHDMTRAKGHD